MSPSEREILSEIRRILAHDVGLGRPVAPDDDIVADLQLDSLALVTLVVELENTFRIRLEDEDAARVRTVAELAVLVADRARSGRELRP